MNGAITADAMIFACFVEKPHLGFPGFRAAIVPWMLFVLKISWLYEIIGPSLEAQYIAGSLLLSVYSSEHARRLRKGPVVCLQS